MANNYRSDTLQIRLGKPRDGDAMARMSRRLIEVGLPWWCWTPKRIAKAIRSPETVSIVASWDQKLAGFALMYFGDENAHLNLLAVEPEFRRKGIGRSLVTWLEESCSVAGILSVSLEVRATNTKAIKFYRDLGYLPGDRIPRYYCGQETALRMTHQIATKP